MEVSTDCLGIDEAVDDRAPTSPPANSPVKRLLSEKAGGGGVRGLESLAGSEIGGISAGWRHPRRPRRSMTAFGGSEPPCSRHGSAVGRWGSSDPPLRSESLRLRRRS